MPNKLLVIVIILSLSTHCNCVGSVKTALGSPPVPSQWEAGGVAAFPLQLSPLESKDRKPSPVPVKQKDQDAEERALGEESGDMTSVPTLTSACCVGPHLGHVRIT